MNDTTYEIGTFGYWWTVTLGKEDIKDTIHKGCIDFANVWLYSLDGAPKEVEGDFIGDYNRLRSLKFCPNKVTGLFSVENNLLTTLEHGPSFVGDDYLCSNNMLESLLHLPSTLGGSLYCSSNRLTSLKGCPPHIKGYFVCSSNLLKSLEDGPAIVDMNYNCDNNHIQTLRYLPKTTVGDTFNCRNNFLNMSAVNRWPCAKIILAHGNGLESSLVDSLRTKGCGDHELMLKRGLEFARTCNNT